MSALRLVALLGLGSALVIFRGKSGEGQVIWLRHSWWGIPGLIDWPI
jgi:hypothetical protein